ncbi:MAG: flagellar export protein FliJ [Lachnospiraceae bacterium]|nr:flagellar export protein FliJ [Lachnospiraceae bacterium]MDD6192538.1 flagellar export protein FliJ [Lachnospiraceae bacterium]MDY4794293.1 flagellar export protein FliJ [Pararoseburia sp.]
MAKFVYRMQNILEIKEKLEAQEKAAYSVANARLMEEQEKLQGLLNRREGYEKRLKELQEGILDIKEIQACKRAINSMKSMIRDQMIAVHTAQRNLEMARRRLDEVMKERKTHENLKEKAFEAFKEELAAEEKKMTDELVSYTYHNKQSDME